MHLSNVADFAPPGYRLERSDMGSGRCTHRFVAEGKPELVCEGSWASADEERQALERFQAGTVDPPDVALRAVLEEDVSPLAQLIAGHDTREAWAEERAAAQARADENLTFNSNALAAKAKAAPKGKK